MKAVAGLVKFIGALGLALGSLGSLAADQSLDVLTFRDGTVVQGQILDERGTHVHMVVGGRVRTYERASISRIS